MFGKLLTCNSLLQIQHLHLIESKNICSFKAPGFLAVRSFSRRCKVYYSCYHTSTFPLAGPLWRDVFACSSDRISLDRACVCTPIGSQGMADTVLPENYIMEETPLGESNSLKSIGTMSSHLIATGKKSSW